MRIHVRHVLCFQSEDEDAVAKQVKSNTQQNEQANDDEEQAEVCMHRAEVSSIKKIYYLVLWNALIGVLELSTIHLFVFLLFFFIKSKVSPNLQSLFYQFGLFCQLELHILQ